MANIFGLLTLNGILILNTDVNPSTFGTTAPIGSFGSSKDGSGLFYKQGATNVDWFKVILSNDIASASNTGALSSSDWSLFNAKQSALGYTPVNKAGDSGVGLISFSNNNGIDVDATGGTDVLNIGTSIADIINIGWNGANVNIIGNVFYENVTNLQVKDKLFTVNKGGAAASGASSGFEIEEGGSITGYFATSGTRTGWDFKAPAIASALSLSLSLLTGNRIISVPDISGILAVLSDINPTNFTGILPISKGGTNSSTALNNDRLIISSTGSIVEHSAQTINQIAFYNSIGLPIGSSLFTWNPLAGLIARAAGTLFTDVNFTFGNFLASPNNDVYITGFGQVHIGGTGGIADKLYVNGKTRIVTGNFQIDAGNGIIGGTSTPLSKLDLMGGDATRASLYLQSQTTYAGTVTEGFVWNDSTKKSFIEQQLIGNKPLSGSLLVSLVDSNTVANTIVETTFTGAGYQFTIPSNSMVIGKTLRYSLYGRFGTQASGPNITFRAKIGVVNISTTIPIDLNGNMVNQGFEIYFLITLITAGALGTIKAELKIVTQSRTSASIPVNLVPNITNKTFNTLIPNTISFSVQWGSANVANTITLENSILEVLN